MAYNPFDMSPQYSSVPDDIQMLIELGKKKKEMAKVKPKEYALPSMTKKELAMSGVAKQPQPQPQPTPVAPQKDYSANKAAIAKIAESIPVVDYVPSFENSKTQSAIDNIKQELANEENIKAQQPTTVNVQKAPGIWQATEFPVPQELDPITKGSGLSKEVLNKQGISRSEEVSNKSNFEKLFEEAMQKQEKEGRTNILYENPLETAARINMIKRSGVFQPQEAGLENMRNLFEIQAQAPTDILTAPITGWMQTELGKNVSGLQAARGLTPEQQRQRLLGYEEKIQDDTKDLMAKYLEAARAPKIGTTSSSVEDTIRNLERDRQLKEISDKLGMKVDQSSQQKTEAADPAKAAARGSSTMPLESRAIRDMQKVFTKAVEPINKSIKFAHDIEEILSNPENQDSKYGDKLTPKMIQKFIARASSEVGNLAQYEQQGVDVPRGIVDRVNQFFETMNSGKYNNATKAEILGISSELKKTANQSIEANRKIYSDQGASAYGSIGLGYDKFYKALAAMDQQKNITTPLTQEQIRKKAGIKTKEEFMKERSKNKSSIKSKEEFMKEFNKDKK